MKSYIRNLPFVNLWNKWGIRAGLSIVDQIIFSGTTFFLNVFLARWLIPSEYGVFVIGFSIFIFISGFHQALILEPVSIIGSTRYRDKLNTYLAATVWIHCVLTLIFSSVLLLVAIIMRLEKNSLFGSFLGLGFTVPFILFYWFFRQVCYLQTKPSLALTSSLIYIFILFLGLITIYKMKWLSSFSAFIIMGIASIGASLVFWNSLKIKLIDLRWVKVKLTIRNILSDHWRYGKWVIGSAFVSWLSYFVYLPLIGIFLGFASVGGFRAMQNTFLPIQKVLTALSVLFIPLAAKQRVIQGKGYLKRNLVRFTLVSILLTSVYVVPVVLFGKPITKILYGAGYYVDFVQLLPWLGAVAIIESMGYGLGIGLKVLERSNSLFWAQLIGTIFTFSLGLYLIWKFGLYGAALGTFLALFLIMIVESCFLWNQLRQA